MSPKIIAFVGKGGEGKTLVAINTTISLVYLSALSKKKSLKVLYIDCDISFYKKNTNWQIDTPLSLSDFFNHNVPLKEIIQEKKLKIQNHECKVSILPGRFEAIENISKIKLLQSKLNDLNYDFWILDIGAGIKEGMFEFVNLASDIFFITQNNVQSIRSIVDILSYVYLKNPLARKLMIVNRVNFEEEKKELLKTISSDYKDNLSMRDFFTFFETNKNQMEGQLEDTRKCLKECLFQRTINLPEEHISPIKQGKLGDFLYHQKDLFDDKFGMVFEADWIQKKKIGHQELLEVTHKLFFNEHFLDPEGACFIYIASKLFFSRSIWDQFFNLEKLFLKIFKKKMNKNNLRSKNSHQLVDYLYLMPSFQHLLPKIKLFLGSKGGIGRTLCLSSALDLQKDTKKKILVVDLSVFKGSNYSTILHFFNNVLDTSIKSLVEGGSLFSLKTQQKSKNIDLFTFNPTVQLEGRAHWFLDLFISKLYEIDKKKNYDLIIFDFPSGIDERSIVLSAACSNVILALDTHDGESYQKFFRYIYEMMTFLNKVEIENRKPLNFILLFLKSKKDYSSKLGQLNKILDQYINKHFKTDLISKKGVYSLSFLNEIRASFTCGGYEAGKLIPTRWLNESSIFIEEVKIIKKVFGL